MGCIVFHKWTEWEKYNTWNGWRKRRVCQRNACMAMQDKLVSTNKWLLCGMPLLKKLKND